MKKVIKNHSGKFFILLILLLIVQCSKRLNENPDVVASVEDRTIDWKLIERSFQLNPKWGRGLTNQQAYTNQLNYLIDQKLYALAAIDAGFDKDSTLRHYLNFIQEKEMIKELYRNAVAKKVKISDEEYESAYDKLKKKVQLNYIYTPDSNQAREYVSKLKSSFISDIELSHIHQEYKGTTPLFTFGDMKPELENVVFDMNQGEVRGPIPINNGYMIVQLVNGEIDRFMSKMDLAEKKSKIKKIIYDRKAGGIANRYIKELMLDKNLELNPEVFYELARQFSSIVQNKYSDDPAPIYLSNEEIRKARNNLASLANEILITYKHGELTVAEFLNRLSEMPSGMRPNVKMAKQLKDAIGVIVRNEYLAKEARNMGLHKSPNVIREAQIQTDEILAKYWLQYQKDQIQISDKDFAQFRNSEKFVQLNKKPDSSLTDKQIRDLLLDIKFVELKMKLAESLKTKFTVHIDSAYLKNKIPGPNEVINYNPVKFVVRELFN